MIDISGNCCGMIVGRNRRRCVIIRIAKVDDELKICTHIESSMDLLSKKYNEKIEIEPYTESTALLHSIPKYSELFDLIFWDIELDEKSGIKIAEYI